MGREDYHSITNDGFQREGVGERGRRECSFPDDRGERKREMEGRERRG